MKQITCESVSQQTEDKRANVSELSSDWPYSKRLNIVGMMKISIARKRDYHGACVLHITQMHME